VGTFRSNLRTDNSHQASKHITTFCSGAILLTATVVAALFPEPSRVWLLSLGIILFAAGVTVALAGLWFSLRSVDSHMQTPVSKFLSIFLTLSVLWAYLGVLSFAFFAAGNLGVREHD
jgi:hypothetical protein